MVSVGTWEGSTVLRLLNVEHINMDDYKIEQDISTSTLFIELCNVTALIYLLGHQHLTAVVVLLGH